MPRVRDTVLLSGWLFADLLLALAALFLVANTGGIKLQPVLPPILEVTPSILDANSTIAGCTGGTSAPQCSVTVTESKTSEGNITWTVSSDISDTIQYSNKSGTLSPGQSIKLTISALPCQNGSFTFNAQRATDKTVTAPVVVAFHCIPPQIKPERLNFAYQTFTLNINDVNAFLNGNGQNNDIKQQIESTAVLQGKSVGLAIVYGGAPDVGSINQAQQVAQKIYSILRTINQDGFTAFDRSSFYVPLYTLGNPSNLVSVDVYFFTR
jgi:hypothetical protein